MLNIIGDWNPQLLRELKGQLKPLKIVMAIALAIVSQIIFGLIMMGELPGSLLPNHLEITTYPEVYLAYNEDEPDSFTVESLYYKTPLEHMPGKDFPVPLDELDRGDRIIAVDGVPLVVKDAQYGYGGQQQILEKASTQPFADDWETVSIHSQPLNPKTMAAVQRLRQQVPGTTVTFTIAKMGTSDAAPVDITLPRITTSNRNKSFCLTPAGWEEGDLADTRSTARPMVAKASHIFFQSYCQVAPGTQSYKVNWQRWHLEGFWYLSIITLFPLLVLGGYSIISNLLKEERDGTFNFIRLSPRSAWDILFGKIIGVPTLLYGAVLLTLPLNLIHGLWGGVPVGTLLSFYGATIVLTFVIFSFAVLFGLVKMGLGVMQAWLGAGIIFMTQFLCIQAVRFGSASDSDVFAWALLFTPFSMLRTMNQQPFVDEYAATDQLFSWFGIPMIPVLGFVLLVANAVVLSYWVWQALERRFFMPTGTIISKSQSYALTLFFNLCLVGFSWRSLELEPKGYVSWINGHLVMFAIAQLILWVILLIALSPQQQSLQDWARYRHRVPVLAPTVQDDPADVSPSRLRPSSLWSDLVWGEKSPVLVAIALNLLMSLGFTLVWLFHHTLALRDQNIGAWMVSTLMVFTAAIIVMLIVTTLVQFVFLYRKQYAIVFALVLVAALLLAPPIALALAAAEPSDYPDIWLVLFPWGTIYPLIPGGFPSPETMIGGALGFVAQVGCLGTLNWLLMRHFKVIGESDIKALLRDS